MKLRSFVFLAIFGVAVGANAQATRTWVSGVGDDANPCSRTAPCKTFAGAISKTAAGGEINTIDSGGFGAVTITKAITIDGSWNHASILATSVTGVIVNAGANDVVTLRNLSINGGVTGLNGVRYLAGKQVNIEGCTIFNFNGAPGRGVHAALSSGATGSLNIMNTTIRNNAGSGVVILPTSGTPTVTVNILDSRLLSGGAAASGVFAGEGSRMTIRNTEISGNGFGVDAGGAASPAVVTIDDSNISTNGTGIQVTGTANVLLSRSVLSGNTTRGFNVTGGFLRTTLDNRIFSNAGANVGALTTHNPQ
jgi:hypothetical protein